MNQHTVDYQTRGENTIMTVENEHATLAISLFGGHIVSFIPKHDNRERLWLSDTAAFDGKTPIRGGIPICWPWFGLVSAPFLDLDKTPSHGVVRNCPWQLKSIGDSENGTRLVLTPSLESAFTANVSLTVELIVVVNKQLSVTLETTNNGDATAYFAALHTYFAINNINNVELLGVDCNYQDKLDNDIIKPSESPYRFNGETDRIHIGTTMDHIDIRDAFVTRVHSAGYDSVVVWNPWIDKSANMADMSEGAYESMLCVETARTQSNVLARDETHAITQVIE